MTESEDNVEEQTASEEKTDESDKSKDVGRKKGRKRMPTLRPDSPPTEFLQYMLSAIGFYDYLLNRPLDMIFQDRTYMNYDMQVITPLLNNSPAFSKIHDEFEIDNIMKQLKENGKKRAIEAGFSKSIAELSKKYTLPIYIGSIAGMGAVIALSWTGLLPEGLEWWIMIPVMLLACLGPTLINYFLQKKWMQFVNENLQDFLSENINEINKGLDFIQQFINIAHNIMMENKLDGRRFRIMCFKNDYEHLNILEERSQRGIDFYIAEFITPPFAEERSFESDKEITQSEE